MAHETQAAWVRQRLESGARLTPMDALHGCGSMRLGARIYDLRRAGMPIARRMVKTENGARVAEYRLEA